MPIHRLSRRAAVREQVPTVPHHQPGQTDLRGGHGEPAGHRGQLMCYFRVARGSRIMISETIVRG